MAENELSINGKVIGAQDKSAGQDERTLLVIVELVWKTGKPAGAMNLLLRSDGEKNHVAECARWPVGTLVRVTLGRK